MFSSVFFPIRKRLFLSIAQRLEYGSVDITLADAMYDVLEMDLSHVHRMEEE